MEWIDQSIRDNRRISTDETTGNEHQSWKEAVKKRVRCWIKCTGSQYDYPEK